jgi:tRNA dimethylallyltransferase
MSEPAFREPVLAVVGPSASGKSDLALRLCQQLDGELVSADSVQIYRRFDIGSAKPSAEERTRVKHHLIDELDPLDTADAARFVRMAEDRLRDILARGKRPVLCGGTFLWVRALHYGLAPAPPADPRIRARHRAEAERLGRPALHARLAAIDPQSHTRLAPNDLVRVSRALEVHELTGRSLSELQAEHGFRTPRVPLRLLGIAHERAQLHERIQARVSNMFQQGWLDEVRSLLRDGYAEARALHSVGYRQLAEALSSGAEIDLPALSERVAQVTRQFVRHQLTWLREAPVQWLAPDALDAFCREL